MKDVQDARSYPRLRTVAPAVHADAATAAAATAVPATAAATTATAAVAVVAASAARAGRVPVAMDGDALLPLELLILPPAPPSTL